MKPADRSSEVQTEEQLKQYIGEFFAVLRAVDNGDVSARVPARFSETEPMAALANAVNAVIERLVDTGAARIPVHEAIAHPAARVER